MGRYAVHLRPPDERRRRNAVQAGVHLSGPPAAPSPPWSPVGPAPKAERTRTAPARQTNANRDSVPFAERHEPAHARTGSGPLGRRQKRREPARHAATPSGQILVRSPSLTYDYGREAAEHFAFTLRTGMPVYFCDPHGPRQRGSVANTKGLIREYFPTGIDFNDVMPSAIRRVSFSVRSRCPGGWSIPGVQHDAERSYISKHDRLLRFAAATFDHTPFPSGGVFRLARARAGRDRRGLRRFRGLAAAPLQASPLWLNHNTATGVCALVVVSGRGPGEGSGPRFAAIAS